MLRGVLRGMLRRELRGVLRGLLRGVVRGMRGNAHGSAPGSAQGSAHGGPRDDSQVHFGAPKALDPPWRRPGPSPPPLPEEATPVLAPRLYIDYVGKNFIGCNHPHRATKTKSLRNNTFHCFWATMAGKFAPAGDSGEFLLYRVTFSQYLNNDGWEICPCG